MPYTHLIIGGGGIKGISIIGALIELENKNLLKDIIAYAGSSVGGLISLLLNIGFSLVELYDILMNIDFSKYQNMKIFNLLEHWGIDDGKMTLKLIITIIKLKGINESITFKELYDKTNKLLILTGSELYSNTAKYYNKNDTPDMKILDALRITISYPCYYYPIKNNNEILMDGAIYNPYPIDYFKDISKKNIIGIFLHRGHGMDKISNLDEYILANLLNLIERYEKFFLKDYENCTIIIDLPLYNAMNFNISKEVKKNIFNEGKIQAQKFINKLS